MISDIWTVMSKELKEILLRPATRKGGWVSVALMIGVFGVMLPLQNGTDWLNTPVSLAFWAWLPMYYTMSIVPDRFAGERERHTLETLLASRLTDLAILLGKLFAAVIYSLTLMMAAIITSALVLNIAYRGSGLLFYPAWLFFGSVLLAILSSMLTGSLAVLLSTNADTGREVLQKMNIAFLVIWFTPVLLVQFLPDSIKVNLMAAVASANWMQIALLGGLVVLVIDAVLLALAINGFKRKKIRLV